MSADEEEAARVASMALPFSGPASYESLLRGVGDRQVVLIGEASHGTHDFYFNRAEFTKWLIENKSFTVVALEADWPDVLRVHRYIQGMSEDQDANAALGDFRRFPQWMWRNEVILDFVEWLRDWNSKHPKSQVGIYGMDLYSLHASIAAVLRYLDQKDPAAATRARQRYGCFDHFNDPQAYGYATSAGISETCEDAVVEQLLDLRRGAAEIIDAQTDAEHFYAEQNARLIANAEKHYRSMFHGRASSWNLRDTHMADTIQSLLSHLDSGRKKLVAWAHNSHLGDARATEMGEGSELNVGQMVRERFGRDNSFLIGFTTHRGTVTAATNWDSPAERKQVRPALPNSYEKLFHETGVANFWLNLRDAATTARVLPKSRLERAIGVIYRPETERLSHYFHARLAEQFDCIIHLDETRALNPLERTPEWEHGELPETYPTGM
jgi:erythromycin esterase-like protein